MNHRIPQVYLPQTGKMKAMRWYKIFLIDKKWLVSKKLNVFDLNPMVKWPSIENAFQHKIIEWAQPWLRTEVLSPNTVGFETAKPFYKHIYVDILMKLLWRAKVFLITNIYVQITVFNIFFHHPIAEIMLLLFKVCCQNAIGISTVRVLRTVLYV